jgi:hypothetical protein
MITTIAATKHCPQFVRTDISSTLYRYHSLIIALTDNLYDVVGVRLSSISKLGHQAPTTRKNSNFIHNDVATKYPNFFYR